MKWLVVAICAFAVGMGAMDGAQPGQSPWLAVWGSLAIAVIGLVYLVADRAVRTKGGRL